MDKKMVIPACLYRDEVVRYLADRYRTTPAIVLQAFIAQHNGVSEADACPAGFRLEDNEMEILRGLAHRAHASNSSQTCK